jgi:hypothetical protein
MIIANFQLPIANLAYAIRLENWQPVIGNRQYDDEETTDG